MAQRLPRVSVFTPTYNHAPYIAAALESVLAQNYPNLQVVVGDDGSRDGTVEIVREYERKYPDVVKVIASSVNTGVTANCNRTLAACDGELLALFSGDDLWLPNKLHRQVEALALNPDAVLCYTLVEVFESASGTITGTQPDLRLALDDLDPVELSYALGSSGMSFLIRRSAAPTSFETSISKFSDWLFWIDVLAQGRAVRVEEVFARYRRHGSNASSDYDGMFHDHLAVLALAEQRHPALRTAIEHRRNSVRAERFRGLFGKFTIDELVASTIEYAGLRRTARALWTASLARLRASVSR